MSAVQSETGVMLMDAPEYKRLQRATATIEKCDICQKVGICYGHGKAVRAALDRFFKTAPR